MISTEWTETGHRLSGEINAAGTIVINCESQALTKDKAGELGRSPWLLSILGIALCTPRPENERLVSHWLSFYKDEALALDGRKMVRDLYASVHEHPSERPPSDAPASLN